MGLKRIKSIEFSVLSQEMIRKMSAVEITKAETYDKDGYPIERGIMDLHLGVISPGLRCKTCGQTMKTCPGHFGHIDLVRPVLHPKFTDKIFTLLSTTCKECGKMLVPKESIPDLMKMSSNNTKCVKEIIAIAKTQKKCPYCGADIEKVTIDKPTNFYVGQERIYPSEILDWILKIPNEDLFIYGYSDKVRPEWFILTVLPISPVAIRPTLSLENVITAEDDLTHMLLNVVRINIRLKDNIKAGAPQIIIEDLWDLLQYNITTYIDNNTSGVPPARLRSGRPLRTLAQRLGGKKGRFRYNLIGKRVNAAARSTITPSTEIKINELGVPEDIANTLTIPEKVNSWNLSRIKKLINNDKIKYIITKNKLKKVIAEDNKEEIINTLEEGMTVKRRLEDGDLIIFNRQPTLHRTSIMGHYIKILPGKTFRINPVSCTPYNADFDGDEMNLHCPQTESSYAEIKNLMTVDKNIIDIGNGLPQIIPEHDLVSGSYLLTKNSTEFTKKEAMEMLYSIGITKLPPADRGSKYSGKLIFSLILPKDLNIEYKNKMCSTIQQIHPCKKCTKEKCKYDAYFKINKGKLISGVLDEKMSDHENLIEIIARNYKSEVLVDFYYNLSKLVFYTLSKEGLTIALDEYKIPDELNKKIDIKVKELIHATNGIVKKYKNKTLSLIPGKNLKETLELEILRSTGNTKEEVTKDILKLKYKEMFDKYKISNNNTLMLSCVGGSRGRLLNVVNILGLWGLVTVRTGMLKNGFEDRLLTLNKKGSKLLSDNGFIRSSFYSGMNPKEYFFHSIGGRQGEIDTGVATKVSGYLYRRLSNALKDLLINDKLQVVTADKQIVQYFYGDDGLSPDKAYLGRDMNFFNE